MFIPIAIPARSHRDMPSRRNCARDPCGGLACAYADSMALQQARVAASFCLNAPELRCTACGVMRRLLSVLRRKAGGHWLPPVDAWRCTASMTESL